MWLVVDGWCKCYVVLLCGWGMGDGVGASGK